MKTLFKVGDKIRYDIFDNITITDEDEKHFVLTDKFGNEKKVFKVLVNRHSRKRLLE